MKNSNDCHHKLSNAEEQFFAVSSLLLFDQMSVDKTSDCHCDCKKQSTCSNLHVLKSSNFSSANKLETFVSSAGHHQSFQMLADMSPTCDKVTHACHGH